MDDFHLKWSDLGRSIRLDQVCRDHVPIQRSGITLSASESLEELRLAHRLDSLGSNLTQEAPPLSQANQQEEGIVAWHSSSSPTSESVTPIIVTERLASSHLLRTEKHHSPELVPLTSRQNSVSDESSITASVWQYIAVIQYKQTGDSRIVSIYPNQTCCYLVTSQNHYSFQLYRIPQLLFSRAILMYSYIFSLELHEVDAFVRHSFPGYIC